MAEDYSDSAMIALVPTEADAQRLAVEGYEVPEQLHVTLAFLGDPADVADWTAVEAGCHRIATEFDALALQTWATSQFNPTGDKPCAVYLVGAGEGYNSEKLDGMQQMVMDLCMNELPNLPEQHVPWIPHLTIGYGLDANTLTEGGAPITFDRLRLAIGGTFTDIPLQAAEEIAASGGPLWDEIDARIDRLEAVVAAPSLAANWDDLLHPRGRDGRFIQKNGWIKGDVFVGDKKTKTERAHVLRFVPNSKNSDDPLVEVELADGVRALAPASTLETTAGPKARLELLPEVPEVDAPEAPAPEALDVDTEVLGPDPGFDQVPGDRGALTREQISALSPEQVTAYVNTMAGQLSVTDPEARTAGLNDIFSGMFQSQIDTDMVHNHLGDDGEQWSPERMELHEKLYDDLHAKVVAAVIPQDRDALALGGLPGAGKSSSLRPGGPAEQFGVVSWDPGDTPDPPEGVTHVSINPDSIKEMLIDAGALPEGISGLKPLEQVSFIHEESSALSKMFLNRLAAEGYNVVLDNTMETPDGMKKRMIPLAEEGYSFRGLFVDITPDESLTSARGRYARKFDSPRGGRFVPEAVQRDRTSPRGRMSANRDAFDELAGVDPDNGVNGSGWFKDFMVVDNSGVAVQNPLKAITLSGQGDGSPAQRYVPQASQSELLERTT